MLARKPIQDISVLDVTGDIDFREMIRIKEAIGSLIEKERTKAVSISSRWTTSIISASVYYWSG